MSTESAVVAAATAAVFSPRTRATLRRGAVLAVAGALKAGDVVGAAARGAARGMRTVGDEARSIASDAADTAEPGGSSHSDAVAPGADGEPDRLAAE